MVLNMGFYKNSSDIQFFNSSFFSNPTHKN
jgi:hypothetical protein